MGKIISTVYLSQNPDFDHQLQQLRDGEIDCIELEGSDRQSGATVTVRVYP